MKTLRQIKAEAVRAALIKHNGHRVKTAKELALNERTLRNMIYEEPELRQFYIPPKAKVRAFKCSRSGLKELLRSYQMRIICERLRRFKGNLSAAARSLKVHRANLTKQMKRLGINRDGSLRDPSTLGPTMLG